MCTVRTLHAVGQPQPQLILRLQLQLRAFSKEVRGLVRGWCHDEGFEVELPPLLHDGRKNLFYEQSLTPLGECFPFRALL